MKYKEEFINLCQELKQHVSIHPEHIVDVDNSFVTIYKDKIRYCIHLGTNILIFKNAKSGEIDFDDDMAKAYYNLYNYCKPIYETKNKLEQEQNLKDIFNQ